MNTHTNYQRGFGVIEIIIVVATVVLLGAIGVVAYNNLQKDTKTAETTTPPAPEAPVEKPCAANETTAARSGTFCSVDIGIKFNVPELFKGKLTKADNYEVFQGTKDQNPGVTAGMSELVFSVSMSGNDTFTFTIAKEPLRSGYIGIGYRLQGAYYNKDTGILTTPMDDMPVPSFMINGTRVYRGTVGDAGYRDATYMAVINDKIVKIKIVHGAHMGPEEQDPSTIDEETVFKQLDDAIKNLEIL